MKKGESLELRVYKALKKAIFHGKLGLNPEQCKLFHQKGYYSKDRQKLVKVDVSIELFLPDNYVEPLIIWIWECKDYTGSIPVGEIEKFNAILDQIGAAKTKGTVISSEGVFDRSAIEYAISKGIGLARLLPDSSISTSHPITSRGMQKAAEIFGSIDTGRATTKLRELLSEDTICGLCDAQYKSYIGDLFGITNEGLMCSKNQLDQYISIQLKSWNVIPGDSIEIMPSTRPIELSSLKFIGVSQVTAMQYFYRAQNYFEASEFDSALINYSKGLEIDPNNGTAYYSRGNTYYYLSQLDSALADYYKAIEVRPDFPEVYYNIACIYSLKKNLDVAIEYLQKAIELGYDDYDLLKNETDLENIRNTEAFQQLIKDLN